MTESEFVALALNKYEQIKSLENPADFYQHEKDRSQVHRSLYVAHLGGREQFEERFAELLDPLSRRASTMVFISDGALWIRDFVGASYPDAVQVLDFYHVKEHLGEWATSALADPQRRSEWVERMYGRRRVCKTFLIRSAYENDFAFQVTGLANATLAQQFTNFHCVSTTKTHRSNRRIVG